MQQMRFNNVIRKADSKKKKKKKRKKPGENEEKEVKKCETQG